MKRKSTMVTPSSTSLPPMGKHHANSISPFNPVAKPGDFLWNSFDLRDDFNTIFQWQEKYYGAQAWAGDNSPAEEFRETCVLALASGLSAMHICRYREDMICYAEIGKTSTDEISLLYSQSSGDYILRLLTNPFKTFTNQVYTVMLKCCLEYIFTNKEVNRVIIEAGHHPYEQAMKQAGFRPLTTIKRRTGTTTLFYYNRSLAASVHN
ncbi:MAG: GNAT family N-acetyltransferase [Chitinophagaceae bacterium]